MSSVTSARVHQLVTFTIVIAVLTAVALVGTRAPEAPGDAEHPYSSHRHGLAMPRVDLWNPGSFADGKRDPSGRTGSGGRAVVHRAGARVVTAPALVRNAPDARLFRTGISSFEPTMGITKKGYVFINALGSGGEPMLLRSTDQGATWEKVFDAHGMTADPYMYVDPATSRIFANDLVPPCHLLSYSDDEGKTWTTLPPVACGIEDHQTIFSGPPPENGPEPIGYPNIVYLCAISGGISITSTASACARSLDGGTTFVNSGAPAYTDDPRQSGDYGVPGLCNGANAHGFVGPDGTVYLPRGWCGQPWLAISKDAGTTWERVQVADNGMPCCADLGGLPGELYSHEAGVVADAKGNLYYTWAAADRRPYLTVSGDGGKTWGKPLMIGPPGLREALLPGIAIGDSGKITVHYMGSTTSPWNGRAAKGSYDETTWNAYVMMTTTALEKDPVFYTATINDPDEPLWRGSCGPDPIRCGWGDFLDVVVAQDGTPWWVGVDLCAGDECGGVGEAIVGRLVGGPPLK